MKKKQPWESEKDRYQWVDRKTGMDCLIVRNRFGALCGYVGVSEAHPWFKKKYQSVKAEVHGGLTYGSMCAGEICHVAKPGRPEHVYWLGFDCAHGGDLVPNLERMDYFDNFIASMSGDFGDEGVYRDVKYVRSECRKLAKQAASARTEPRS